MIVQFRLPDLGEGITEAELVRWLVKPGDTVTQDQEVVEVQTDKAMVELPSPVAGIIRALHVAEGQVVPVETVLLTIDEASQSVSSAYLASATNGHGTQKASNELFLHAEPTHSSDVARLQEIASVNNSPLSNGNSALQRQRRRTLATPVARRMARELGIDITRINGSGPSGRVQTQDVQQTVERMKIGGATSSTSSVVNKPAPSTQPSSSVMPSLPGEVDKAVQNEERLPLRGLRRRIAENMVLSVSTIPQVTSLVEVDATGLVALRRSILAEAEAQGVKLSYLPLIIKALVHALRLYPYVNATIDDERKEIVLKHSYHIGIATATPDGLLVPVVRNTDRLTVVEIASEVNRLAEAGRNRKLQLQELRGSSFTISNYGTVGGFFTTPIINPGEAGILGLGRIVKRPWVVDDQVEVRPVLPLSFTADHRLIDGELAMRFLNTLIASLENPSLLLLNMR